MANPAALIAGIAEGLYYGNKLIGAALMFASKVDRGEMTKAEADAAFAKQAAQIFSEEARFDKLLGGN
jgi:hypothetical protein